MPANTEADRLFLPCLTLRAALSLFPIGGGQMRNSSGDYGPQEADGKPSRWCGCVGVVQGVTVGFVLLDHPGNPGPPPRWRVTPEGRLSLLPFAQETAWLAPGESHTRRCRLLVHQGYVEAGWADARLEEFAQERNLA
jgi:hypothetical protein